MTKGRQRTEDELVRDSWDRWRVEREKSRLERGRRVENEETMLGLID